MSRKIKCVMLGEDADGLDFAPYPGELGQRIYDNVSKEAWGRWLAHQTMLINEYRLTPIEPQARQFLAALDEHRLTPRAILLTHTHIDHAGGAGHFAQRFPGARIAVPPAGASHLIEPSRLWSSVRRRWKRSGTGNRANRNRA